MSYDNWLEEFNLSLRRPGTEEKEKAELTAAKRVNWSAQQAALDAAAQQGGPLSFISGQNTEFELKRLSDDVTRKMYLRSLTKSVLPYELKASKAIEIFCSYAHKDDRLRAELLKQLNPLMRVGLITVWHDREILGGAEWELTLDAHLNTANIILLLVSPDFISSDYCYYIEMDRALERHYKGAAEVIPIILRPCKWDIMPFGNLQALPTDGKPVTTWRNKDQAFKEIADGIEEAVKKLKQIN